MFDMATSLHVVPVEPAKAAVGEPDSGARSRDRTSSLLPARMDKARRLALGFPGFRDHETDTMCWEDRHGARSIEAPDRDVSTN